MVDIADIQDNKYVKGEIILIDKPLNWTSFDVVNRIRYKLCRHLDVKRLKVGHAGTLDPLATGLMIICTGKKTKEIEQLQNHEKEYIATIHTGAVTDSFDLEHEPKDFQDNSFVTKELVLETLNSFLGEQEQYPPVFSAKKINGKPAYIKAHKGKGDQVQIRPQTITIKEIELLDFTKDEFKIRVFCSKGTYIRSLANDIGKKLGCGAYLSGLRRTQSGDFSIKNAISVEDFEKSLASCQ